jgi:signal transduction histidine kinase
MLHETPLVQRDEALRTYSGGIASSIDRLEGIINSILDVSKMDVAALKVRKVPTSIAIIVTGVAVEFRTALKKRGLRFEAKGLGKLPFIEADSDLLYKAFYHLVMNAIKYTPDGGRITVNGRLVPEGDEEPAIEIVVADTGIGIDQQHHELIFEKFYQTGEVRLHSSGATKFKGGGPGLGLAIAKGAVAAHGGEIWVESPGHDEQGFPGSRFFVRLPLNEWPAEKDLQRT